MPKLPDFGVFLKRFCDSGSCQCRCSQEICPEETSRPIHSYKKAQEDIGSCSKCRKSSVAGELGVGFWGGLGLGGGGLGRQAGAPRDLVGEGSSCLQHRARPS